MNLSCLELYCTLSISFNLSDVGKLFWSWILKDCIEVLKKNCVPILHKSWNKAFSRCSGCKEMYKKTLMHVQSRCFANLNLLLFCCSCWSCHHCCLSSLLAGGNPQPPALSDSPERVLTFSIIRIRLFPRVLAIIPSGGIRDFKWQGWSKDFFGFEIFDSGIFLGTKIWLGWLDLCRDFFRVLKRIRWGKGYIQMVWWINKHECSISTVFLCVF